MRRSAVGNIKLTCPVCRGGPIVLSGLSYHGDAIVPPGTIVAFALDRYCKHCKAATISRVHMRVTATGESEYEIGSEVTRHDADSAPD